MKEYLGLDNRALDHDLVMCRQCKHEQYERPHPLNKGGKYAWRCDKCGVVNETGKVQKCDHCGLVHDTSKVHLLERAFAFFHKRGYKNISLRFRSDRERGM